MPTFTIAQMKALATFLRSRGLTLDDHEFQRWYPPRDLSVESIQNLKLVLSEVEVSKIRRAPAFIRGVASKI